MVNSTKRREYRIFMEGWSRDVYKNSQMEPVHAFAELVSPYNSRILSVTKMLLYWSRGFHGSAYDKIQRKLLSSGRFKEGAGRRGRERHRSQVPAFIGRHGSPGLTYNVFEIWWKFFFFLIY
jgi:hypothetical protein